MCGEGVALPCGPVGYNGRSTPVNEPRAPRSLWQRTHGAGRVFTVKHFTLGTLVSSSSICGSPQPCRWWWGALRRWLAPLALVGCLPTALTGQAFSQDKGARGWAQAHLKELVALYQHLHRFPRAVISRTGNCGPDGEGVASPRHRGYDADRTTWSRRTSSQWSRTLFDAAL